MKTYAASVLFPCFVYSVLISLSNTASLAKRKVVRYYPSTDCETEKFLCENGICIKRSRLCDGKNDCGDGSDEEYCEIRNYRSCPTHYPFYRCSRDYNREKCIPDSWKCDGFVDCHDRSDETDCLNIVQRLSGVHDAVSRVEHWLMSQANIESATNKWGSSVPRTAVALFFVTPKYFSARNQTGQAIAYELYQRLLHAFISEEMGIDSVSTNDLAVYINALTVSCVNVRSFYGIDLVKRLSDKTNHTPGSVNPSILLTLCISGQDLSEEQINALYGLFDHKTTRTEKLAFALMSLSCVADKGEVPRVPRSNLTRLAAKLKRKQQKDGGFETTTTTSLVLQALIASGEDQKESSKHYKYNFSDAIMYLHKSQSLDGSFGGLLEAYYALPVLQYSSLLDINSDHCNFTTEEKKSTELEMKSRNVHVIYSVVIGEDFRVVHTITVSVLTNSSFFDVMNVASSKDPIYRFKHVVIDSRIRVYEVNGIQDDFELERYWFLFKGERSKPVYMDSSPAEVIIQDGESFMMWYRSPDFSSKNQNSTATKLE